MKRVLTILSLVFILVGCNINKSTIEQNDHVVDNLPSSTTIYESTKEKNNLVLEDLPSSMTINKGEYINLIKLGLSDDFEENNLTYKISTSVIDTTSLDGGEHPIVYTVTDENGEVTTKEIILIVKSLSERLYDLLEQDILTADDYLEATKLMYELEGIELPEDENIGDVLDQFYTLYSQSFITYNEEEGNYTIKDGLFYEDEDFVYLNEDKEVIIKYKNLSKKDVMIPNGVKVIGYEAFCQTDIESVVIPSSVETIEAHAFRLTSLTSVYIPENVNEIGIDAFDYYNISDLSVSSDNQYFSVKNSGLLSKDGKIYYHLFGKHTEYSIPEGVTVIARKAFSHKYSDQSSRLENVTIPNSVVVIGEGAFEYCFLTSLTLPNSVKAIGRSAFFYNKLTKLTIPNSVTEIWPYAFWDNDINDLTLGTGVKVIDEHTFGGNNLSSIIIPEGVEDIKDEAFVSNPSTFVSLPSTVKSVGIKSFSYECVENFKINENNQNLKVQDNGLLSYDGTVFFDLIGEHRTYDIPYGVTTISFKAFSYAYLNEVTIPATVVKIEKYAFLENSLDRITIPEGVTEIEDGAFLCNSLNKIVIEGDEDRFNDRWTLIGFPSRLLP